MSARVIHVAAFLLLVAVLLYVAALQHQGNCIDSGRVSCSLAPWDNGHPRPAPGPWDVRSSGWGG